MNNYTIFILFFFFYLLFVWKLGKTFPILYLFFFTYFLQYIFSTYLIYNVYTPLTKEMAIPQERYFDYAVPALFFLFAGVAVFNKDFEVRNTLRRIDPVQANRMGYLLLVISYFFDWIQFFGIDTFSSLSSFTTYLKYISAFCFLFTNSKIGYGLVAIIYAQLGAYALRSGVFIDFFMWTTYLFIIISFRFELKFWMRASFILIAAPLLILVQSVKSDYREATWVNQREGGLDLFTEIASDNSNLSEPFLESEGVMRTVGRLSQGWHVALTLRHVPEREPFSDGRDMLGDVIGTVLPRIFFSDKKIVGSQGKFYQFTGRKLHGSTSMTIGVLGDFYVNYGVWGSFIMLFVFGGVIALLLRGFLVHYVNREPLNIIWVPFLLSYLIRANNDFYIVFNCLVKGFIIFLLVTFIRKQLWPPRQIRIVRV